MSRYYWELEAVFEGKLLEQVDQREMLAELAFNVRYTMNAEKPKIDKMFNKKQEERKVKQLFNEGINNNPVKKSLVERVRLVNEYFKKKGEKK